MDAEQSSKCEVYQQAIDFGPNPLPDARMLFEGVPVAMIFRRYFAPQESKNCFWEISR